MSLPLVLTDIRGCREVARDAVEGLLVPVRDPRSLAVALERLLTDEPLRRKLGEGARARAVARFDERQVFDTVIASYRRLLARKGIPAPAGPRADGVRIRRASTFDARALARLHASSMPTVFPPTLGERFLTELYRSLASQPGAVIVVAENGTGVVGFAAGTTSVLKPFGASTGGSTAPAPRSRRPRGWCGHRCFVGRGSRRRTHRAPTDCPSLSWYPSPSIEMHASRASVAVSRELLAELAALGADEVKVVVDAANHPANRLYEAVGFRRAARLQIHGGTSSNVWKRF